MKIHLSYLILAHDNLPQVEYLVRALQCPGTDFYIHFDDRMDLQMLSGFKIFFRKNVHLIKSRITVNWGGYNMVAATLKLMRAAIARETDYLILLSGQDLPIKSNAFIHSFYQEHYGKQFINYFSLPRDVWAFNGGLDRLNYFWFIDDLGREVSHELYKAQLLADNIRKFFPAFTPYGGSQWWSLTADCVRYILKFLRVNKIFDQYMRYCLIPDELYFQNILLNSPLKAYVVNDNLKYIDWHSGPDVPRILTMEDYPALMASSCLYARKFNTAIDTQIITKISKQIGDGKRKN